MLIPYAPPAIQLDSEPVYSERWNGLTICIENPKGTIRHGKGWQHKMLDDYGYIEGFPAGADGDDVDCYLAQNPTGKDIYVVNQGIMGDPEKFDEHKALLGYTSVNDAKHHYIINHSQGALIFQGIKKFTLSEFKRWLTEGNHSIPV